MTRKSSGFRRPKIAEKAAQVGVALTAGKAGIAAAAATTVATATVDILEAVRSLVEEDNRRKIEELLEEAYFRNAPREGAALELKALLERPAFRRVLVETVRAKLEAPAAEVTPALAMLMREYEQTGREPDWFFRGFCRVLQDLSAEEYAEIRSFVRSVLHALRKDPMKTLVVMVGREARLDYIRDDDRGAISAAGFARVGEHTTRVVTLMAANGLGIASSAGPDVRWQIDVAVLRRVHALVNPSH